MILQELRLETIMDMQLSHVTIKNQTQKKIFHQTNQAGNWLKNFASIDQMPPCMVGPLNQSFHWSGPRTVVYWRRERERESTRSTIKWSFETRKHLISGHQQQRTNKSIKNIKMKYTTSILEEDERKIKNLIRSRPKLNRGDGAVRVVRSTVCAEHDIRAVRSAI